jgi:hypothetical protein
MALLLPHFNFPLYINTNDRIAGYAQGISIIHMSVAGFAHIYAGMVVDDDPLIVIGTSGLLNETKVAYK